VSEAVLRVAIVDRGDEGTPVPLHAEPVRVATHRDAVAAALAGRCEAVVVREGDEARGCVRGLAGHPAPVIVLLDGTDPAEFARAGAAASLPYAAATPELLECVVRHAMAAHQVIAHEEGCRHLLELLREAVLVQTGERVAYANAAAAAMLGLAGPEELLGRPVAELFHPDYRERAAEHIRIAAEGGRALPAHERLLGADGAAIEVEITAGPVEHVGEPSVLIVARDIRERLRLESSSGWRSAWRRWGGWPGAWRTTSTTSSPPSRGTRPAGDGPPRRLAQRGGRRGDPGRDGACRRAHAAALAFGRGQVLIPRVLDLNAALSASVAMLRRLVPENVEVATELDPGISPVHADPQQLDQVLVNLALNARDAMPHGGTLRLVTTNAVVAETDPRRRTWPRASTCASPCATTARGWTMPRGSRCSSLFHHARPGKGAGLGLATVYGIVKQSGGYITVESEAGARHQPSHPPPARHRHRPRRRRPARACARDGARHGAPGGGRGPGAPGDRARPGPPRLRGAGGARRPRSAGSCGRSTAPAWTWCSPT
jgi:PAS domain S-box-containing protein